MKYYYVGGTLCLLTLCMTLEGGGGVKKEDVPKYLKMLQTSQSGKERATAAEMLGKRGAININDVKEAIEPLKTSVQKDVEADVRKAAAGALAAIGSEQALASFGPNAKSALPAIRELATKQKDNKKVSAILKAAQKAIASKKG
jgi:HEAT repeat protein